jgi:hypothetical protein
VISPIVKNGRMSAEMSSDERQSPYIDPAYTQPTFRCSVVPFCENAMAVPVTSARMPEAVWKASMGRREGSTQEEAV